MLLAADAVVTLVRGALMLRRAVPALLDHEVARLPRAMPDRVAASLPAENGALTPNLVQAVGAILPAPLRASVILLAAATDQHDGRDDHDLFLALGQRWR